MAELLNVLMRWVHITSVAVLIGGVLYAKLVVAPVLQADAEADKMAQRYRSLVYAAISGLLISGVYTLLTTPGHTPRYHMILGLKLLLALHVFAVAILIVRPAAPRRARRMAGIAGSGLIIILISAYLRRIF